MFVCCCLAVTDEQVAEAIEGGAFTRDAVTLACRAGGDCGACHGAIEQMIEDRLDGMPREAQEESGPMLVSASALVRRERAA